MIDYLLVACVLRQVGRHATGEVILGRLFKDISNVGLVLNRVESIIRIELLLILP